MTDTAVMVMFVVELADRLHEGPAIGTSMSMLSVVSTRHMPAVNSAGKTRIDQMERPLAAPAAEMPSSPTSVAVSKPRPNSRPSGYMVPAALDQLEQPAKQAAEEAPAGQEDIQVLRDECPAALTFWKVAKDGDENDEVGDGDGEQEKADTLVPIKPPRS